MSILGKKRFLIIALMGHNHVVPEIKSIFNGNKYITIQKQVSRSNNIIFLKSHEWGNLFKTALLLVLHEMYSEKFHFCTNY